MNFCADEQHAVHVDCSSGGNRFSSTQMLEWWDSAGVKRELEDATTTATRCGEWILKRN
jgi:hypothetical protein